MRVHHLSDARLKLRYQSRAISLYNVGGLI